VAGQEAGVRSGGSASRLFDVASAAALLALASPLLALTALVVRCTMGRPVLYRERRAGRRGEPFDLLKFRTMRPLAEGETIPDSDRDRITPVGRALRATSIDELPTLVNVLRGHMSIVGPRPLPVRYVERYTPGQARRLAVRPGMTGWAQVNGRNATSWDERFALDAWYVSNRSWWLDARILLMTVGTVFRRRGTSHADHATMPEFDPPSTRTHA
jgi:sugar transferase EpsL